MHKGHCNSAVVDSKLINNRGNAYLSLYQTGGVDGLLIQGNTIRTDKGTSDGIAGIFVDANRHGQQYPCRNVHIIDNITAGSGIEIAGAPGERNLIAHNRHEGAGGKIIKRTSTELKDNIGYAVEVK